VTRAETIRIATVVAALLVLGVLVSRCQAGMWHVERQALVDSAREARALSRADSVIASAQLQRANAEAARSESLQATLSATIAEADRLRALRRVVQPVASQPDAAPTVSDTVAALDSALTLCDEETLVLRAALDTTRKIRVAAERESIELRGALSLETTAASKLRAMNEDLAKQLARAAPPCRVLFFGCPSRMQVGIGSAVVTLLAVRTIR
jgi:hypothetical protein